MGGSEIAKRRYFAILIFRSNIHAFVHMWEPKSKTGFTSITSNNKRFEMYQDHTHNNRIFHIKCNRNATYCNILSWVAWTAQLTMFLAEWKRWWDRCSYKMHSLAARAYITGRVFSALGLLTLPRRFLVWGKVQKGLHYHCSLACSSKTFVVCKKVQWVLCYKGVFSP